MTHDRLRQAKSNRGMPVQIQYVTVRELTREHGGRRSSRLTDAEGRKAGRYVDPCRLVLVYIDEALLPLWEAVASESLGFPLAGAPGELSPDDPELLDAEWAGDVVFLTDREQKLEQTLSLSLSLQKACRRRVSPGKRIA